MAGAKATNAHGAPVEIKTNYWLAWTGAWDTVIMKEAKLWEKWLPKGSKVEWKRNLQGPPVITDLVAGHLPMCVTTLADTVTQHRAGGIRILAVSGPVRSQFLPDVPTLKESGVDIVADGWYGMWLPAGSPPDFARKLSVATAAVLARPDVAEKLKAVTLIPVGSTPEELTKALAADTAFWQPIVQATGYKIAN